MEALLIYPHQLYKVHRGLKKERKVILVEEPLFFTERAVHRQKLMLHRLSMRSYARVLEDQGFNVSYLNLEEIQDQQSLVKILKKEKITSLIVSDVTDDWLERRIEQLAQSLEVSLVWITSQLFILEKTEAKKRYIDSKKFMKTFYRSLRIDKNVLMNKSEPEGGKWSFDEDNRKKLPKDISLPSEITEVQGEDVDEVREWVNQLSGEIYGEDIFWIPFTHAQAEAYLEVFLKERFEKFGDYEDSISKDHARIFHSTLSPMINIGLLDPMMVIDRAINFAKREWYSS